MSDFDDTATAFAGKSDGGMRNAVMLFGMMRHPGIVKTGKRLAGIAAALRLPTGWALKPTLYRQFVGGETLQMHHLDRMEIFMGSHNEQSNYLLARLLDEHGIARNDGRVFFAQLYGMGDHISFNLAAAGYNVVKYVPYAGVREVLPYLIRRAEENTSVAGQTARELTMLKAELRRRREARRKR